MQGRLGIVSGRYRSLGDRNGRAQRPTTVIELFGRMEDGRSACLLVHGLRPTFELAPIGQWEVGEELPAFLKDRLRSVKAMDLSLIHISEPTRPY